jgi:ribosomal protein S18 acetylase RimI-like enzyme
MGITRLQIEDLNTVANLYKSVTKHLQHAGIHQWDRFYPNPFIIKSDLKNKHLFGIKQDGQVIAAVVIDDKQSPRYKSVNWAGQTETTACIHRLAVHPDHQGQGLGKKLLQFAEAHIGSEGYSSIRLDVFSDNEAALGMYERWGYKKAGVIRFPFRKIPYFCYEKMLW